MDIGANKYEWNRYAILDAKQRELRGGFPVISMASESVP